MSGSLNNRVLESLEKASKPLSTLEITHAVGFTTRKQINPTLYDLEKVGKICKVSNVPPTWSVISSGPSQHQPKQQQLEQISQTSPEATAQGSGIEVQIVSFLSRTSRACTALDIAKGLGYKTRKEVNPHLYAMAKDGLITRIDGKGAPQWCVPCENTSSTASGASTGDHSHIPMDNIQEQLLAVLNSRPGMSYSALELSRLSGCGLGRQLVQTHLEQLQCDGKVKASSSVPIQWGIVEGSASQASGPSMSHQEEAMETELTVEDHVLAALKSKPGVGQTALEVAKCIGMKATRHQVSTVMEHLCSQGKVRCISTVPQQWTISETNALSPPLAVNTISDLSKNPVSVLNEYCQSKKIDLTFPVVREYGPPHRKQYVVAATFGGNQFKAESSNKQEAKRMAADLALQSIGASATKPVSVGSLANLPSQLHSFPDKIASMSHSLYLQLQQGIQHPQPGRKVIAAFVMEDTETANMEVVSIGSGNQCITGSSVSSKGLVVNDSHAEVVARRSLIRYFYRELLAKKSHKRAIYVDSECAGLAEIPDKLKFHLYISTAPCGDGALFSRDDNENRVPPQDDSHRPTMESKKQAVLRTKIEGGEGTIPVDENIQLTWDGILHGDRLRTMSCSDKILRWNVLGLQGALLGRFMKPVYMSSLTLGSLHHHGHLSRAVCCRASELEGNLPFTFTLNHPTIGRVQGGDAMERHTEKTSIFSLNWAFGDDKAELTDGVNGRPVPQVSSPSRISKASLFSLFVTLCEQSGCSDVVSTTTYSDAKKTSLAYHQAKQTLFDHCKKKGYGHWVKKPDELELFTIGK